MCFWLCYLWNEVRCTFGELCRCQSSRPMARGGRGALLSIINTYHSSLHWINHKTNVRILNLRHSKHNVNNNKGVLVFLSFCFRLLSLSKKKTSCQNKLKMQKQTGFFPGISFFKLQLKLPFFKLWDFKLTRFTKNV